MRLATLAWRGLTARRLRSALTIMGVALGVALVAGTLLASQAASEAVERAAREILGRADLRVRAFDPAGFTPRAITALRQIPGVVTAAAVAERRIADLDPAGHGRDRLRPGAGARRRPGRTRRWCATYDLEAGAFLSADRPYEVLVNAAWASRYGLEVGDGLMLSGARRGRAERADRRPARTTSGSARCSRATCWS